MKAVRALDGVIPIAWAPVPFAPPRRQVVPVEGRAPSIIELVTGTDIPVASWPYLVARVNDHIVPREVWHLVRPRPTSIDRPIVVTFELPLGNGGAGGLRTALSIVVLLAAAAVSGGALGPAGLGLLGASFGAGAFGATVAGAGIAIAGTLAVAAIFPPPSIAATQQPGVVSDSAQLSSASLSGNMLARGSSPPYSVGTNRVTPPLACEPLQEIVGDDEYAEAVYVLAGAHLLNDVRVGDVLINSIPDAQVETSFAGQVALVSRQGKTEPVNLALSRHLLATAGSGTVLQDQGSPASDIPFFHTFATRAAPDEVWFTLVWPSGLFFNKSTTTYLVQPYRLRMRQVGAVSWVNLPELHVTTNSASPRRKMIKLKWASWPGAVTPPDIEGFFAAFENAPAQTATPSTSVWQADAWFHNGVGTTNRLSSDHTADTVLRNISLYSDRAEFYLGGGTFPQGIWEIEIQQGQPYDRAATTAGDNYPSAQSDGLIYDFFYYWTFTGTHYIQIDAADVNHGATVARVSSVWNQHPIQTALFTSIGVQIKNRSLEPISVLASAYVNDWNGSAWATATTTSNPAPHLRNILLGSLNLDPLSSGQIDNASLVAWRANCASKGFECNCVIEGLSVDAAADLVAAGAYGRVRRSDTWGVIYDHNRASDIPTQVFSARTMRGFGFDKTLTRRVDGFRVKYRDETLEYREEELIVLDPAASSSDYLAEIRYDSLTDATLVNQRALYDIGVLKQRLNFYSGTVSAESIVCQRGDLVAINNDILTDDYGAARIKSVTLSGGNVSTIVLDGSVPGPNSTGAIGVSVRLTDDTIWTRQVTGSGSSAAELTTLTFSPTIANPGSSLLTADCLAVVGKLGTEYKRMLVFSVTPKDDMSAEIVFVDEAPSLVSAL